MAKDLNEEEAASAMLLDVIGGIKRLKDMMNNIFDEHYEAGLYTLKLNFMNHIAENRETFGILDELISSPI